MNIEPYWYRICGLQVQEDGQVAAVWLAHDKVCDRVYLYDCHLNRREVLVVQAEAIKRRGARIPVAWPAGCEEITDRLLRDYGVNMLPEAVKDSEAVAETVSLELEERMRTGRFKVDLAQAGWLEEYRTFHRQDGKVPRKSHPLMAATRNAVAMLDWARPEVMPGAHKSLKPKLAII